MRVYITGASGQLGKALARVADKDIVLLGCDSFTDICDNKSISESIRISKPDLIIHAAAYTDVDRAETDAEAAFAVNCEATRNIAEICRDLECPMIYISTDYVFDGKKRSPYKTDDTPNPQSVYGKSKLAGEKAVIESLNRYYICRTAWLYGEGGANFLRAIIGKALKGEKLKVVDDQRGSPTYAIHLAEALFELARTEAFGLYHTTSAGDCTWYDLAKEACSLLQIDVDMETISTEKLNRPAPRPAYSVLDGSALMAAGVNPLPFWKDGLKSFLKSFDKTKCF